MLTFRNKVSIEHLCALLVVQLVENVGCASLVELLDEFLALRFNKARFPARDAPAETQVSKEIREFGTFRRVPRVAQSIEDPQDKGQVVEILEARVAVRRREPRDGHAK